MGFFVLRESMGIGTAEEEWGREMTYETFLAQEAQIESQSVDAQKQFYKTCLKEEQGCTDVRVHASYSYGALYFWEGDFRKVVDIVEPVVMNYQSYPFSKKLLGCFNLLGTAMHCESEYIGARFMYGMALKLAKEHGTTGLFAREYNNIASVYVMEGNDTEALRYLREAEKVLPDSEEPMGAFIHLNKTVSLKRLGRLEEALEAYETAIREYDARNILPDDTLLCGLSLYYALGDRKKYEAIKAETLERLNTMHSSEAMETCQNLFECGMDAGDDHLLAAVFRIMDDYMENHPEEIKVGRVLAELKYRYAEKSDDKEAMLRALQLEKDYEKKVILQTERDRVSTMANNFRITTELQRAVESKERASQAKTRFLRSISHDIRTPLNGIIGLLKVDEAHADDAALVARNRGRMQVAANHLLGLINDVLDMSRIEEGSVKLSREAVDMPSLYREITTIVEQTAAESGVKLCLEGEIPDAAPWVYGSPNHLRQIFLNIYSNCIKYNHLGGTVTTAVEVDLRQDNRCVYRWTIRDTGIGMSKEFLQHIFEPFEQERNDARSTYNGSGLGMSIAQGLVEQMGGSIAVSSREGKGSRFVLTIPFEIASAPQKQDKGEKRESIRGLKLLLVEDNELNADIARILLTDRGAAVTLAENGQQAVELFESSAPGDFDAILMDVMMPVMDGMTASGTIRALSRPDAGTIPIIAMTANAYAEDVKACLDSGMNAHLGKPLDMEQVAQTIAACCGKSV